MAATEDDYIKYAQSVSTHSHPKVAAFTNRAAITPLIRVSTHSHPKVAAVDGYGYDVIK